jgi:hypothetical protein
MWCRFVPLLLLVAAPAWAQDSTPGSALRRVLGAAPLSSQVRLDGRLDEPAWATAQPAADFTQAWPAAGEPASHPTEVRVLVGTDALYVGARMFDTHPDSIVAQLSRRDVTGTYSDRILVFLDSQNDRRTAFQFAVNPRA